MPNLLNPYLKVSRAKEHLESLRSELAALKSYTCTSHDDLERGQFVIDVHFGDPPLRLAVIAGDFICCLRSALDYLAWQLAALGCAPPQQPGSHVHFPIFGELSSDTLGKIKKATEGMPSGAIVEVKALQPYEHGPNYKLSHLWRLNALWNIDKHRYIAMHSTTLDVQFREIDPPPPIASIESFNDHSILRIPLAFKPKEHLNPLFTPQITFGDMSQGIELTIQDFTDLYEFVAEKTIPRFTRFFPRGTVVEDIPDIRHFKRE